MFLDLMVSGAGGGIHLRLFFSSGSQDVDSVSAVGGMGDPLEEAGGHK